MQLRNGSSSNRRLRLRSSGSSAMGSSRSSCTLGGHLLGTSCSGDGAFLGSFGAVLDVGHHLPQILGSF